MENPFEIIIEKLNRIELLLTSINRGDNIAPVSEVLNINEAAKHVSLSKSALYKMTSEKTIPHFKRGKKLYFKTSELDQWLTENRITTKAEIEKMATGYVLRKKKRF